MPFTANRIKYELAERGDTLSSLAREWGCHLEELSMCISRARTYPELRIKISRRLGLPVNRVFGSDRAASSQAGKSVRQKAA